VDFTQLTLTQNFDILHAFLGLTVTKLSSLKTVRFFGPPCTYLLTYLYAVGGCDARRVLESQTVREQLVVGVGQRAHRVVVHPDRSVDVAVVAVLIARWRRRLLRLGVVRSPVRRHHV